MINEATAFESVCKCLDGIVRSFSIAGRSYKPEVLVTILADNLGALSKDKDGQLLPNRTFFSNLVVTEENFSPVIEKLYDMIVDLENEILALGGRRRRKNSVTHV
jgi:hypothetical protein